MVIITSKKTKPRPVNDFYRTPDALAERMVREFVCPHMRHEPFILDAGAGDGVFGRALRATINSRVKQHVDGIDIVAHERAPYDNYYVQDFREYNPPRPYHFIVGNPPYKLAEEFVRHAFTLLAPGGKIIFLLKLAFLESKGRARGLFVDLPLEKVSVLAGRPSFDGTGKTNDYAFAVFVWCNTKTLAPARLSWLDWN